MAARPRSGHSRRGSCLKSSRPSGDQRQRGQGVPSEDPLALGAGADEADRDVEALLDELDVAPRSLGKLVRGPDAVEGLEPSREGLVDRPRMMEVALVRRELLG